MALVTERQPTHFRYKFKKQQHLVCSAITYQVAALKQNGKIRKWTKYLERAGIWPNLSCAI